MRIDLKAVGGMIQNLRAGGIHNAQRCEDKIPGVDNFMEVTSMSRKVKAIGILLVFCVALSISLLAYAKAGTSASDAGSPAQQGAPVVSAPTQAPAPTQMASGQSQAGADDEKVAAEKENESESEEASGQDPIEAPGTPGYEEGNFDGQHEF